MISFIDIADRLEEKEDKYGSYRNEKFQEDWKPERCDDYTLPAFRVPTYNINVKGAKAKWQKGLANIYTFIKSMQHKRYKEGCTIIPIPTTAKVNLDIWGTPTSIVNARKAMCDMGLISLYTNDKFFGKGRAGKSFTYKYYKENEDCFVQFCKDNNIEPRVLKNDNYDEVANITDLYGIDKTKVRFATHLRLEKPKGVSDKKFEKALIKCLYENYPQLSFYQRLADTINLVMYKDKPEFRIRFKPNFNWAESGKSVTSIGIRATNKLVSVKKEDRPEILEEYGLTYEKDVKSSVPRLTRSMDLGAWYTGNNDFYEEIFRICEPDRDFTDKERKAVKKLYMRAYFDNSAANVGYHTWNEMDHYGSISESDVRDKMAKLREAIEKVSRGKTYGNEIFYIESCVYLGALFNLLVQGYETWVLYDCFYCKESDKFKPIVEGFRENFDNDVEQAISLGFDYFYNFKAGQGYHIVEMLQNSKQLQEGIKNKEIKKEEFSF